MASLTEHVYNYHIIILILTGKSKDINNNEYMNKCHSRGENFFPDSTKTMDV